jgi:hypothetical protein
MEAQSSPETGELNAQQLAQRIDTDSLNGKGQHLFRKFYIRN